jgi:hypothetical protein
VQVKTTTDKTRTRASSAGPHAVAAPSNDAIDRRILRLSRAAPIRRLQEDFADHQVPMELVRGDEAPLSLRGRRPQAFVDAKVRQALCIAVSDPKTSVSDVVYVAAEALATAYDFPRDPGDKVQEALVNSFALSYLSGRCGTDQAIASFHHQIDKLQRARLQKALGDPVREAVALRCWAIGTALDIETRQTFLGQVEIIDEGTAELIVSLTRAWGSLSPSSGVDAARMLASAPF